MGFRFRRSLRIFPGVHLNFSKSGVSLSIGGAPLTFNWGRKGGTVTGSVPGTGASYSEHLGPSRHHRSNAQSQDGDP